MQFYVILVILIAISFPAFSQTGIPVPQYNSCDQEIQAFMTKHNVPGAVMAIARNGKLIYNRGFGTYDLNQTDSTRPYHLFRVASVSKSITGIAIMKLMEDGLIDLDQKAFGPNGILDQSFYDSVITDTRIYNITVRQLLKHTAGWDRSIACPPFSTSGCDPIEFPLKAATEMNAPNPVGDSVLLQFTLQQGLNHNPGTTYAYSNMGYLALGKIIEKVSGMSYENYVRTEVILPAGACDVRLGKTLYEDKQEREAEYHTPYTAFSAWGTGQQASLAYGGLNIDAMNAHGGWIGTAEDLVRLILSVDGFSTYPNILSQSSIDSMSFLPAGNGHTYAYGWDVNQFGNWWHVGSLPGTASVWVRTSGQYAWVFITNFRNITDNSFHSDLDGLPWYCISNASGVPAHDLFPPKENTRAIMPLGGSGGSLTISWLNGTGTGRIVVAKDTASAWTYPKYGRSYTANSTFGQGDDIGGANFVMYDGSGSQATLQGFDSTHLYNIRVYEYSTDAQGRKLYRYCDPAEYRTDQFSGGLKDNAELNVGVSPNPAKGMVNVQLHLPEAQSIGFQLLDAQGREVLFINRAKYASGEQSILIDLPDLNNGLYFLRIDGENSSTTKPVVVSK